MIDLRKSCGRGGKGERATGNKNSGERGLVEEGCNMKGMFFKVLSKHPKSKIFDRLPLDTDMIKNRLQESNSKFWQFHRNPGKAFYLMSFHLAHWETHLGLKGQTPIVANASRACTHHRNFASGGEEKMGFAWEDRESESHFQGFPTFITPRVWMRVCEITLMSKCLCQRLRGLSEPRSL